MSTAPAHSPVTSLERREAFYRDLRQTLAQRYSAFDPLSAETCFNIAQAFSLLDGTLADRAHGTGLTLPGLNVLLVLYHTPGGRCPLNILSQLLVVSRANITGLVDSLVRKGLVKREDHPTDRRVVLARITAAGETLIKGHLPKHYQRMRDMTKNLSKDEKQTLCRLLSKLRHGHFRSSDA